MDILLQHGDHATTPQGIPRQIDNNDELLQRALLRLSIPRGRFFYDPLLGSALHTLGALPPEARNRAALSYAREALAPLAALTVLEATCQQTTPDTLVITLSLSLESSGTQTHTLLEVTQTF